MEIWRSHVCARANKKRQKKKLGFPLVFSEIFVFTEIINFFPFKMLIANGASTGLVNNYFCAVNLYIFNSVIAFQINSTFCAFRHFYFLLFCGRRLGISYLGKPRPHFFLSLLYIFIISLYFCFVNSFLKNFLAWEAYLKTSLNSNSFCFLVANLQQAGLIVLSIFLCVL